jgi:hypothetical protein
MKNLRAKTIGRLLMCVALLSSVVVADAGGTGTVKQYQALTVDCSTTVSACVYDDQGNCLRGTKIVYPASQTMCVEAHWGNCLAQDCASTGAPVTSPCCSN